MASRLEPNQIIMQLVKLKEVGYDDEVIRR